MSVQLNHTIVHARDQKASADFYVEILGLSPAKEFYHFTVVTLSNNVTLDLLTTDEEIQIQHYAFLVSEEEFDLIFGRIQNKSLEYWADPGCTQKSQINHYDGGRGCYFKDPAGHVLEIITRPYGDPSPKS